MHDPAIGRFGMVDPLADKYTYNSTYAFSGNRLIDGVELEGKEWTKKGKYFDVTTGLNRDHLNINYFVVNNTNNFSDQDLFTILNRTRASVENRFSNPIKNDGSQFYDLRTFLRQDFVPPKISISYEMIDKANVQDALKKGSLLIFSNDIRDLNGEVIEGRSLQSGHTEYIQMMKGNRIVLNMDVYKNKENPYGYFSEVWDMR